MTVRSAIQTRLAAPGDPRVAALPLSLKPDAGVVRTRLFRRLAASRLFALGDRTGTLRSAQKRSGRAFRLDVRQRVVVKALVSRHVGRGIARGAALASHIAYLGRSGAGADGARATFFDGEQASVEASSITAGWSGDRHHFRFIISPEHGDRLADLPDYVREVMRRVTADLGDPGLNWFATCHYDTDQPHAHVLLRGRRSDGRDLVIPRAYVAYGFRARAQEVAQERLGDLSRADAERRIWRETEAERFTGFDRRLRAAAASDLTVADGVGRNETWAALTRGRLRRLESLGLAVRVGERYRLDPDLEPRLRSLQLRRDIMRTFNQRRMEGAKSVRELGVETVQGRVVRQGSHDELGSVPYVVVRDGKGAEHYARLAPGASAAPVGAEVTLQPTGRGTAILATARGQDLGRFGF